MSSSTCVSNSLNLSLKLIKLQKHIKNYMEASTTNLEAKVIQQRFSMVQVNSIIRLCSNNKSSIIKVSQNMQRLFSILQH